MIVENIRELKERLKSGSRLLGIDHGAKIVGLAVSDFSLAVATPHLTVYRSRKFAKDAEMLRRLIAELGIGGLVIGLPLGMDGSEGPRCRSVRDFAANLQKAFADKAEADLPVFFHDERLSTAAVQRMLISEADMTRRRRAEIVDETAAAYILQGALNIMAELR